MISAPRGTHDVLPDEHPFWAQIIDSFRDLAERYGYRPIITPTIEHTELIERTSGHGSDILQKEIYTFEDRSGRSLALRPEATAAVARAYLEHGLHRQPQPVKTYLVGQMFRYDRPQRGRYREFWQLNVEAMGAADAALDAEVIRLYHDLLGRLGLRRYWLELNSIGDRRCRPAYIEELNGWLDAHPDVLTPEVVQKRETSPLRVFDVKDERVRSQLAQAPKIGESLCDDCRRHFDDVRRYLDAYGVPYTISPTLVRGLDYYTRTAFEFLGEALGAKDSICGGGRYDYLIEEIGGPPTPGVGWAAGIERLVIQLQEEGRAADADGRLDVFVVADEHARVDALRTLSALRAAGLAADADYAGRSENAQIKHANRLGSRYVVILAGDKATVRERGRDDREVARGELVSELRS